MRDPRPSHLSAERRMTKEEVSFGCEHSRVSRSIQPSLSFSLSRKNPSLSSSWRDLSSRRMEYRATGRENARVSSGGEQRVTRGSILYRGRGPPLVTAMFSPMHDRCHSLRMAVADHAEVERGHTEDVGALPCASPSAPFVPPSCGVPTRVDFLQITLDRVEVHRRRAHLRM